MKALITARTGYINRPGIKYLCAVTVKNFIVCVSLYEAC
jgi:hypothetical protein